MILKRKAIHLFLITMLFVIAVPIALSFHTQAAQKKIINLKTDKVYGNYDITGNGKKDRLYLSRTSAGLDITINENESDEIGLFISYDKVIGYPEDGISRIHAYLFFLNGKDAFIDVAIQTASSDHIGFHSLYQVTKRGFVKSLNPRKAIVGGLAGMGTNAKPTKVNGKYVTYTYDTGLMSDYGSFQYNIKYKLSKNKLTPTAKTYKITKTRFIGGKKIKLSKKAGKFKAGETVKFMKVKIKGKKSYLHLKSNSGKQGWIRFTYRTFSKY